MNHLRRVATIKSIHRYPVKSMAGESLPHAELRWHGIDGDRRFAFMRAGITNGMPWLTASKLPELILYQARVTGAKPHTLPTVTVKTPEGTETELESESLRQEIAARFGADVTLMGLYNGIFDDAPVSIISTSTIKKIESESSRPLDPRRFRPNILIEPTESVLLDESSWVGKTIILGANDQAPAVCVTLRDIRCSMVNLDPDSAAADTSVLSAIAKSYNNCAGVYANVVRIGSVSQGDGLYIEED